MTVKITDKQRENREEKERKIANLKPFKPGKSGNPKGRPKGWALSEALRFKLRLPYPGDKHKRTYAEVIADVLFEEAIEKRNIQAVREIFDRIEGKPKQAIDLSLLKSEAEKYEAMITDFIEQAAEKGIVLTRDKAIEYLAKHDERILEVIDLISEEIQ